MSIETTIEITGVATLIKRTKEVVIFTPYEGNYYFNYQRENVTEKDGVAISRQDGASIRKTLNSVLNETVDLAPTKTIDGADILSAANLVPTGATFTTSTNKEISQAELVEIAGNMLSGSFVIDTPTTVSVATVAAGVAAFGDKWDS